jgi:hypothetical protein
MGLSMGECRKDENLKDCSCSYPGCSRKGMCCECLRHHLRNDELPACCFPADAEKTYDRSVKAFIRSRGGKSD